MSGYAGPTDGVGHLTFASSLIADNLAGATAELVVIARGVQQGTHHALKFNDYSCGELAVAPTCQWSRTVCQVPLDKVKFPAARGAAGQKPAPKANTISITVSGPHDCLWFRAAILKVKLMSPIVLIHGNNSDGGFFVRQGFASGLESRNLLWDSSITMVTDTRANHAVLLSGLVRGVVASFGVDSAHLIAHSKGGLDAREYLATFYKRGTCKGGPNEGAVCEDDEDCADGGRCKRPFDVLSLTTLSTPHNGTVLADLWEQRRNAIRIPAAVDFPGFPAFTNLLLDLTTELGDPAYPDLTTYACAFFNQQNVGSLPAETVFNVIGADADYNWNGRIDASPDEFLGLRIENAKLASVYSLPIVGPSQAANAVDVGYHTLRNLRIEKVEVDETRGWPPLLVHIEAGGTGQVRPNDTLVTTESALGTGRFYDRTRFRDDSFGGPTHRDHATVANFQMGQEIKGWLSQIEAERGDLRSY